MQLVEEVRSDLDTPQNWAPLRPTDNLAAMSLGNGDIIVSQEVLPPHAPPPPGSLLGSMASCFVPVATGGARRQGPSTGTAVKQ